MICNEVPANNPHAFIVLPDDNGIRPAGQPDHCFYCHQKVGTNHAQHCVCIVRSSVYGVYVDGVRIGTFTRDDPADWSTESCEFHKNDSSWCKGNVIGDPGYEGAPLPAPQGQEGCLCEQLTFRLESRGSEVRRSTS